MRARFTSETKRSGAPHTLSEVHTYTLTDTRPCMAWVDATSDAFVVDVW
jgi:hypothetical protein